MTENIAGKKQNYFKELTLDQEGPSILQRVVALKGIVQVKDENSPPNVEYTKIQPARTDRAMIYARHISGPGIVGPQVTMMMEVDRLKYFAQGKLMGSSNVYELKLINLYELQRRNFFRVSLPPSMFDAKFEMDKGLVLPLIDLAIGGAAVAFDPKYMKQFEISTIIGGTIKVAGFDRIAVRMRVKHRRRRPGEKGPFSFAAGCELVGLAKADAEKIGIVVNECHRQYFMRMQK